MEKHITESSGYLPIIEERAQLVRYCTALSGDRDVAEDLVQETLLEAWRHENALRDATKRRQWLAGIARNVYLRWRRKRGRDAAHLQSPSTSQQEQQESLVELENWLADDCDIEMELERKELAELLDRALALLPKETRTLLIKRYVEESPLAEVAAQFDMNPHALTMRLQRGKLALRRVLTQEMRQQLAPYASAASEQEWETTPLWCNFCGMHRFEGKRDPDEGKLLLRCPSCKALNLNYIAEIKGVKGYKPMYARLARWCDYYYRTGLRDGAIACPNCGRSQAVIIGLPEEIPVRDMKQGGTEYTEWPDTRLLSIFCHFCHNSSTSTLEGLCHVTPEGSQFYREHGRIRTMPTQEMEAEGRHALVSRFESIAETAHLTVISDYETFEVLRIYREG